MISTGIEALDRRVGSLKPGGLYAFFGSPTSGKSILGLHFLVDGLARREHCVLVTGDEPAILESRAAYIGAVVGEVVQNPLLRVVRGSELANGSAVQSVRARLEQRLGLRGPESRPARIVFDSLDALADYVRNPHEVLQELKSLLERTGTVAYVLLRPEAAGDAHPAALDTLTNLSDGSFRLVVEDTGQRWFQFLKAPGSASDTDRFRFNLRLGAGFAEDLVVDAPDVSEGERHTLVVLDENASLSQEVLEGLQLSYRLELLRTPTGALGRLSAGRYGALVVAVDPFDDTRAFDLVLALRKAGNAAPIICAAPSRGLRSTTRSRSLRAGADDFFVTDLATYEVLERIQLVWQRGTRRRSGFNQIGQFMQPLGSDGAARPMNRPEFLQVVATLLAEQPPLFFGYLEFSVPAGSIDRIWPALRRRLRLGDGDLVGRVSDRQFACVLNRTSTAQVMLVMDRIRAAHPELGAAEDVLVLSNPTSANAIAARLGLEAPSTAQPARAPFPATG